MSIAIPLLALVVIFLFKRRLLQARLNIMNVILCLGYYAMLALYVAFIVKGYEPLSLEAGAFTPSKEELEGIQWYLNAWAAIPLVNIVLTMMATRRILKDEALVRAADRLR
jgi:Ca2+/Na+ antiporter